MSPPSEPEKPASPKNGVVQALTTLASSGDNWVKIVTIGLIALSGGSNFFVTTKTGDFNAEELKIAISEIHDLHKELLSMLDRQKEMREALRRVEARQQRAQWQGLPNKLPESPEDPPKSNE